MAKTANHQWDFVLRFNGMTVLKGLLLYYVVMYHIMDDTNFNNVSAK
jgi:hypothetical protein